MVPGSLDFLDFLDFLDGFATFWFGLFGLFGFFGLVPKFGLVRAWVVRAWVHPLCSGRSLEGSFLRTTELGCTRSVPVGLWRDPSSEQPSLGAPALFGSVFGGILLQNNLRREGQQQEPRRRARTTATQHPFRSSFGRGVVLELQIWQHPVLRFSRD